MSIWRQLRWRIVGAQMAVVLVGVALVLLVAYIGTQYLVPEAVAARVMELANATDAEQMARATDDLLDAFRSSITTAVTIAALGAILTGLGTSLLLAREILRPLRQIALSSQRIASGHYDERVALPGSDELGAVATHFNQMAEALERTEETRVALIGDISHELRTPLTSLDGYLEGMLDGVFPVNEETAALMYQEVRRMRRLVDDLQTLSRVEAGQISLHLEPLDLRDVAARVVAQLQPQAAAQSLDVELNVPETAVLVYADPDRSAQILLNLVGNALRYTPEGGRVRVDVATQERFGVTAVSDTGIGIAPDNLPYLFERFYRVDRSRARRSGGSGIGLTISRHLAWAMGGDLHAASDGVGQGSTFTLTLPLAAGGANSDERRVSSPYD